MAIVCALLMSTARLCAMAATGTDRVPTPVPRGNTQGVGRGRGFVPARPGQDVGSGISVSATGSLGDDRAGLAPADGRKRPISSPPLRLPSQIKKIKPPADSGRCSELSSSDLSQSLLRRIDEFFYPPPCDPSSGLWSRPHDPLYDVFPDAAPPPYIVIMESTRPGKNLGKYDRLALAECIDLVIDGGRTIFYNGLNQVKIHCESREDANTLVRSQDLMRGGFKLFIPSSLIRKKASASFVPSTIARTPAPISCDRPSALIAVATMLLPRANALSIAMSLRSTSIVCGILVDFSRGSPFCSSRDRFGLLGFGLPAICLGLGC